VLFRRLPAHRLAGDGRRQNEGENEMIFIPCEDCEDGIRWTSRRGGNDPDVWAVDCETCGGRGGIEAWCDLCAAPATHEVTDWHGDEGYYCDACHAEVTNDAGHDGMPDLGEPGEP
jgi:hypothetical protein